MKTLYLGYYDFHWCRAYTIENNELVEYEMSKEDLWDFEELFGFETREDRYVNIRAKLNKYFKEFDRIIACEEGMFYLIK